MKIYLVGGAVRDKLLGKPIKDRDWVVVGTTPEKMIAQGFKPIGKDFPVFLHPKTKEEYALARTERKSGKGYKGFTFYTSPEITIEEDLKRRDLTINAIAEDESGKLIDPFAGKLDIENKVLRHVSSSFVEDPLRLLRIARFSATIGFEVAENTMNLLTKIVAANELDTLTVERIWNEFQKAMGSKHPENFILILRACNALKKLFPQIDTLFGIPQPKEFHPEIDTGLHTLMALKQATLLSNEPIVRFAALLHDLGKGSTPKTKLPSHHGHEARGVKLVNEICTKYKSPTQYRELACITSKYHLDCHRIMEMKSSTILKKLERLDAFRRPKRFQQFLLACEADHRGRTNFENKEYPQAKFFISALKAANNVNVEHLKQQGLSGKLLGDEIRKKQMHNIQELCENIK